MIQYSENVPLSSEIESVIKSVKHKTLRTLLYKGTKVGNHTYQGDNCALGAVGDEAIMLKDYASNQSIYAGYINRFTDELTNRDRFGKGIDAILVTSYNSQTSADDAIFVISGSQKSSGENRGLSPYQLYIQMPRAMAQILVRLIMSDPMNLEKFYQQAFPGLDSQGNDTKGIKRIKTKHIYLIDIEKVKQMSEGKGNAIKLLDESTKLELPQEIGILDSF